MFRTKFFTKLIIGFVLLIIAMEILPIVFEAKLNPETYRAIIDFILGFLKQKV